jgi:3-hydroxyanthranilate 3,4-dioxygenase
MASGTPQDFRSKSQTLSERAARLTPPINFPAFLRENAHLLTPPVNNKLIFGQGEFQIQVVGGPNHRSDFHVNEGEEYFYQVKGRATVTVALPLIIDQSNANAQDNSPQGLHRFQEITLNEGDMFVMPSGIPHNPRRYADTIGLVVERERLPSERDHLRYQFEISSFFNR